MAGGWDQTIAGQLDLAPRVIAFSRGTLDDGLARAASHFGIPAHPLSSEHWLEDAVTWAQSQRLAQVVTLYAPVGAWSQRVSLLADRLAATGIRLAVHRRRWDHSLWPAARAGYFRFRKQAEPRLRELLARHRHQMVGDEAAIPG